MKEIREYNITIKEGAFITCFAGLNYVNLRDDDNYYKIIAFSALLKRQIEVVDIEYIIKNMNHTNLNEMFIIYIIKDNYDEELRESLVDYQINNIHFYENRFNLHVFTLKQFFIDEIRFD